MQETIRILIVEDRQLDVELAQREVKKALANCVFDVVETQKGLTEALDTFLPHLIISDYVLPEFDGMAALEITLERTPLTPLIILTGSINEETAVECLKAGATDYVTKEYIARLGPAVQGALRQSQLRHERVQMEQNLRQSEERYRTLVNTLPDAIAVADTEFNATYVSPLALRIFGYSDQAELLGRSLLELVHPLHYSRAVEQVQLVLSGQMVRNQEYLLQKKDGTYLTAEVSASSLKDSARQVTGITLIVRDITVRKQSEEQLIYQASLLQNVSDAIIATDLDFRITVWNQAATEQYGWSIAEATGQLVAELLQTEYDSLEEKEQAYQDIFEQGHWKGEVRQKHQDGSTLYIFSGVSLFKNSNGEPVGAVAVNRNITNRKRAEKIQADLQAQLQQAQKMESIGRLAGGVAHDFNNLLTVIRMYSELLYARIEAGTPMQKQVEQIRLAGQRAEALTRQLLAFSRKQMMAPKTLNLNELVSNLHAMLGRLIGEDITFTTRLQPELWSVRADASQLEQVIVNLAVNARAAMPTGGLLSIETHNVHLDEAYAASHFQSLTGPCVLLTVSDTGYGMDEETKQQIFEPFFTTKPVNEGTGLGLATVHGIIKQSGGDITVYSEPNKGTTFKIYLPARTTTVTKVPPHHAQPHHNGLHGRGTETILLVEDEVMVRHLVCDTLQASGYTVLEARDSLDAITIASHHEGEIHLLLTDVVMPRMSGRELAELLQEQQPHLHVLFVSGYTDDAVVRHGLLTEEVEFLQKPFSPGELTSKVRSVLDK